MLSRRRARDDRGARRAVEYDVDPCHGQKTGLFLDQRENRDAAARYARGRLLDCVQLQRGFALALAPRCAEVDRDRHLGGRGGADPPNAERNGLAERRRRGR